MPAPGNFFRSLLWYYHSEANTALIGGSTLGGLFLVLAFLLWRFAAPLSVFRGLVIPLLLGGLIIGIGGQLSGRGTRKELPSRIRLYEQDSRAFFREETAHVNRIHRSWTGIRIFWSVIAVAGIVLWATAKSRYRTGLGIGALLLGLAGHALEAFSYQRNERYRQEVLRQAKVIDSSGTTEGFYKTTDN